MTSSIVATLIHFIYYFCYFKNGLDSELTIPLFRIISELAVLRAPRCRKRNEAH